MIHEYAHLLQATTTVYGIGIFISTTQRFVLFFNAIQGQPELKFPMSEWALEDGARAELKEFAKNELRFIQELEFVDGRKLKKVESSKVEFSMEKMPVTINGKDYLRWHVIRKLKDETYAVPILAHALGEAQAECMSAYFLDLESKVLEKTGKETKVEQLFYTSIPALVARELPQFPLNEIVFLLTDFSLMTFAAAEAFHHGLNYLKKCEVPKTLGEWDDLRLDLKDSVKFEKNSISEILKEIDRKVNLYGRHGSHEAITLFLQRLSLGQSALKLRQESPFKFFPWERTAASLEKEIMCHVPISYAHFTDGVRALGNPSNDLLRAQSVLSAATFLFDVLREKKEPRCLVHDDPSACPYKRTYECGQYPWGRGDVGGNKTCMHGMIGLTLGIDKSCLTKI